MGEEALYTKCKSLIHIRNAGMWKDGPENTPLRPKCIFWKKTRRWKGSRASLLEWGEGGGTRVENSKGKMGMIAP